MLLYLLKKVFNSNKNNLLNYNINMKKVVFNEIGDPEILQIVDAEIPTPKPNEVLIKIKACGLNRAELLFFQGLYFFQPEFPEQVGLEASGVVEAIGKDVTGIKIGQSVSLLPNINPTEYGYIAEYALAPQEAVQPIPDNLNYIDAAAIWMSYTTAYGGLVFRGGLKEDSNQTVVISAASSSVGLAAIQVAKQHGATVIATTRTSEKKKVLLDQGADFVIATTEENFVKSVAEITNNKGFDIAFDPIGGSFINDLAEAASNEAIIVIYGLLSAEETPLPLVPMLIKGIRIEALHVVFHILDHPDRFLQAKTHVIHNIKSGIYTPIIDKNFDLDEIQDAYKYMESNKQKGKIIINI